MKIPFVYGRVAEEFPYRTLFSKRGFLKSLDKESLHVYLPFLDWSKKEARLDL